MDLRRRIIAVVAVVSLVAAIAFVAYQPVKEMSAVSSTEVTIKRMTDDGNRVAEGWINATLVVDKRSELTFRIKPENETLEEDSDKDIPPGTQVSFEGVSVVLKPGGNPFVHGPVRKKAFIYDDRGYPSSEDRIWKYYSLGSHDWTARHVPYKVKVYDSESGDTLVPWTSYMVGYTDWDDGVKKELLKNIKLTNLGELLNGVVTPTSDFAYIWNKEDGETITQYVSEVSLKDKFDRNPPGPNRVNVGVSDVRTAGGNAGPYEKGKHDLDVLRLDPVQEDLCWTYEWRPWGPANDATAEMVVTDLGSDGSVELAYDYWEEAGFGEVQHVTTLSVSGTDGFIPEKYYVTETHTQAGTTVMNEGLHSMDDGTAEIRIRSRGHVVGGPTRVEVQFYGATNTWSEFVEQTDIKGLRSVDQNFVTSRPEVPNIPDYVTLWDGTPSFYSDEVPTTNYQNWNRDTGEVAVYELPGGGSRAFVQVKAPTDIFDTVVWKPPYGKPKIESVSDVDITGGEHATLTAEVKNIGYTGATFDPDLNLPEGMNITEPVGLVSIPKDGTEKLEWTVSVGGVESDHDESGTLEVTGTESLESDSSNFTVHMKASPGPQPKTGDLSVTVLDKKTKNPVVGAKVKAAGLEDVTGSNGVATIYSLSKGNQTVTVSVPDDPDYGSASKTVYITPETMNTTTVYLSGPEPPFPWAWVIVGIGIAGAVIAFIVLRRKGIIEA